MTYRGRAHRRGARWALVTQVEDRSEATALSETLESHGVGSFIESRETGWALFAEHSDRALARALCDTGVELAPHDLCQLDQFRGPPARRSGRRLGKTSAVLLGLAGIVTAGAGAGAFASAPAVSHDASHWTASKRAFHADDDRDGTIDRVVVVDRPGGVPSSVSVDHDRDGVLDRFIHLDRVAGHATVLRDVDGDGLPDPAPKLSGTPGARGTAPSTPAP
jgi:hypothetical protein